MIQQSGDRLAASAPRIVLGRLLVLLTFRRLERLASRRPELICHRVDVSAAEYYAGSARKAYHNYARVSAEMHHPPAGSEVPESTQNCVALARELNLTLTESVRHVEPAERYEIAFDVQLVDDLVSRLSPPLD